MVHYFETPFIPYGKICQGLMYGEQMTICGRREPDGETGKQRKIPFLSGLSRRAAPIFL